MHTQQIFNTLGPATMAARMMRIFAGPRDTPTGMVPVETTMPNAVRQESPVVAAAKKLVADYAAKQSGDPARNESPVVAVARRMAAQARATA